MQPATKSPSSSTSENKLNEPRKPIFSGLLHDAARTSFDLFKIMIPISIAARILVQMGAVEPIGKMLAPVMNLCGLPGSMGIVWATAMITNIYGGMAAFAALAPAENLTVAQATVLGTMILLAHTLPVELRVAQKSGPRFRAMAALRLSSAVLLGVILNLIYTHGGWLQQANRLAWMPESRDNSWPAWAAGQAKSLLVIFLIILALLVLMRVLSRIGVIALLTRWLAPALRLLGISAEAAPLTIVGMTMGMSYGGGMIIQEAKSGKLAKRDIFFSVALMSICHSVIEDSLLVMAIGAHFSGVFWARIIFALVVIALLVKLVKRLPEHVFEKYLVRK